MLIFISDLNEMNNNINDIRDYKEWSIQERISQVLLFFDTAIEIDIHDFNKRNFCIGTKLQKELIFNYFTKIDAEINDFLLFYLIDLPPPENFDILNSLLSVLIFKIY
jgi:hypothetical protein